MNCVANLKVRLRDCTGNVNIMPCYAGSSSTLTTEASDEPPRDKTNNVAVRPAKTQISLGIRPV